MAAEAGAWEPTRTVEFIVPAGTGGGADQMARMIQGVIQKNELMDQSLVVINKSGGAGAEGFLDVKGSAGNPNKIVITLSNVFTTPLATGMPFNYQDITPVGMLAMDEFILWVNAKSPYQTAADYVAALKASAARRSRWAAPGPSRRTRSSPPRSSRRPAPSSPTSRSRAAATWRRSWSAATSIPASTTRSRRWRSGAPASCGPLCVFGDARADYKEPIADGKAWADIPTCKESGLDIEYNMLRGIFTTPGATPEQVAYYSS